LARNEAESRLQKPRPSPPPIERTRRLNGHDRARRDDDADRDRRWSPTWPLMSWLVTTLWRLGASLNAYRRTDKGDQVVV
jgi:hypothetical protein